MLCSTYGTKVHIVEGAIICANCDSEFDVFDVENELVPEPIFVAIRLGAQYAIIDTRKQVAYLILDSRKKSEQIAFLLNKHFAELELKKR